MAAGVTVLILFLAVTAVILIKPQQSSEDMIPCFVVIPFESFSDKIKHRVKCCMWDEMSRAKGERREILLVSLDEDNEEAEELADSLENVRYVRLSELEGIVANRRSGEETEGAGKDKGRGRQYHIQK